MKHIVSTCILVALFAIGHVANADDDDEGEFKAKLRGGNEVPAVETDTTGKAEFEFNDDETEAEIKLKVRDGVRVTQAHIHCAPEGSNGPVVVFLAGFHELGWDVDGTWIKNETVTDANIIPDVTPSPTCPENIDNLRDLAEAIRNGNTYVNVHTVANRGGEIRGQLEEED